MARMRKIERRPLESVHDAALFFFVAATGAVGIFATKYALGASQWVVTATPCLVMVIYAALIWVSGRYRLREDQAGDNLYYLGFLFTLTSLAISLYEFTLTDGTEHIVSNFGIAIFTTILGIALRIFFTQMRRDPIEIERTARLELAQAAARLRAELDQASLEFVSYRRTLQQQLAEGYDEMDTKARSVLSDSLQRFERVAAETTGRIETAFVGFAEGAERHRHSAERSAEAIEHAAAKLAEVEPPKDMISQVIEPTANALRGVAKRLERYAAAEENAAERMERVVPQTLEGISQAVRALEGVGKRVEALVARIEATQGAHERRRDQDLEALSSWRHAVEGEADRLLGIVRQISERLGGAAAQARGLFARGDAAAEPENPNDPRTPQA